MVSALDYLLFMIPPSQFDVMICRCTIQELAKIELRTTTKGEILKFFETGLMLLMTNFDFGGRARLWSKTLPSKYVPAPAFG
jgi:hypothetical protein